jgi:hypothetical protein
MDGCRRCAGTGTRQYKQASKTGDTESEDEDKDYEKVCFTGSTGDYIVGL